MPMLSSADSGTITIGSRAVTGIGTGSVIHHQAIQVVNPVTTQAFGLMPAKNGSKTNVIKNSAGPANKLA
ncbi:hypothetical protein GCM10009098_08270 [Rheinheimera aquimaris]|uniref:Uncharacterized protein n=1 Tax=Rheinheimera aquimaris TaxID=412437 RepID=A0ABP3NH72_9GAMM